MEYSISLYLDNPGVRETTGGRVLCYVGTVGERRSYCGELWLFCSGSDGGCVANKAIYRHFECVVHYARYIVITVAICVHCVDQRYTMCDRTR